MGLPWITQSRGKLLKYVWISRIHFSFFLWSLPSKRALIFTIRIRMQIAGIPLLRSLSDGMKQSCLLTVCNFPSAFSYSVISVRLERSSITCNCFSVSTCLILLICVALLLIRDEECCFHSIVLFLLCCMCKCM